ncbi:MAG: hypothetical protein WA323_25495 [Candidatus Nitrosopolaris sp.]
MNLAAKLRCSYFELLFGVNRNENHASRGILLKRRSAHQLSSNQEQTVIEPISTFLNKYQNDIDSLIKDIDEEITINLIKLHPKMAYKIRKAKEQLNQNVGDLIKYLCRLKMSFF